MSFLFPHHLFLGREKKKKKTVSNVSEMTLREVSRKHQEQGRGSTQAHRERVNISMAMLWQSQLSKDLSTENLVEKTTVSISGTSFYSAIPMDLYVVAVNNSDITFPKPSKLKLTHREESIRLVLLRIYVVTANVTILQNYPLWMVALPQPSVIFDSAHAFTVLPKRWMASAIRFPERLNHFSLCKLFFQRRLEH